MDLGDSVEIIEGSLGSGKSAVAHLNAILHIKSGGVVACNYGWIDNWSWRLAGQDFRVWLGLRDRMELATELYQRCWRIGTAESMYTLSEKMPGLCREDVGKKREGKGLLIIDEAHHYFNARNYQKNGSFVEFFSNARKLGWRTIIVTHSSENIDKQIRSYVDFETRFRNLKKVKIPFLPLPMSPIPAFLAVRRYAGLGPGSGSKAGQDLYVLDKWSAALYDTNEVFRADSINQEARLHGDAPRDPEATPVPVRAWDAVACRHPLSGWDVPYHERVQPNRDLVKL